MQQAEWRSMGVQMRAAVHSGSPLAAGRLAALSGWFAAWEARLSRFDAHSELSRLNARSGEWVAVSPVLWEALQAALHAARDSDGLVTPLVLGALEAAGYDRSFEALRPGNVLSAARPQPCADWRRIDHRSRARSVRLPPAARLDLGGIGKGWAADRAAKRLAIWGPALVDAGGDIAISDPPPASPGWPIGVADPLRPDELAALLVVPRGGVATSGRDYRRWRANGREQHHLIDPRTGQPALTDVLTASVVAPGAVQAETAAKVAVLLGSDAGLAWIDARPGLAALLIRDDGRLLFSRRIADYLWRPT